MSRIRVLIVDDSVVIRRLLTDILGADPEIEVAGSAATGAIALAKLPQVNPDVVTLDIEMPGLSGLQTLAELRKTYPRLPVIMFSTLTERGATATLDALALGANDYVTKPANVGSVAAGMQAVRESLVPKIKALCGRRPIGVPAPPPVRRPAARATASTAALPRVDVLAIGVSTGGPNALCALLPQLPADLRVPLVIVQHMPPIFTRLLARRLDALAPFRVAEAAGGETLQPGHAWLAPGDHHLTVHSRGPGAVLALDREPPENSCRPAVDPLFRSVAAVFGSRVLAVVLTGMGQDGLLGSRAVCEAGGRVLAQDEASSVVWGMPGAVVQEGLAERVLPLADMAEEITRRIGVGRDGDERRAADALRAGGEVSP